MLVYEVATTAGVSTKKAGTLAYKSTFQTGPFRGTIDWDFGVQVSTATVLLNPSYGEVYDYVIGVAPSSEDAEYARRAEIEADVLQQYLWQMRPESNMILEDRANLTPLFGWGGFGFTPRDVGSTTRTPTYRTGFYNAWARYPPLTLRARTIADFDRVEWGLTGGIHIDYYLDGVTTEPSKVHITER